MEEMEDMGLKAEIEEIAERIDNTMKNIEDLNILQSEASENNKD